MGFTAARCLHLSETFVSDVSGRRGAKRLWGQGGEEGLTAATQYFQLKGRSQIFIMRRHYNIWVSFLEGRALKRKTEKDRKPKRQQDQQQGGRPTL